MNIKSMELHSHIKYKGSSGLMFQSKVSKDKRMSNQTNRGRSKGLELAMAENHKPPLDPASTRRASSASHHVTRTVPIISRCSCRPKSMALPLKNHLKAGSRDGSQDTSQGSTRLWPTSASRLSGGTVILVGSEGIRGGRRSSHEGAGPRGGGSQRGGACQNTP